MTTITAEERAELRRAYRDYKHSHHVLGDTILVFEAVPKLLDALDIQDERIKELEADLANLKFHVDQQPREEREGGP